MQVNILDAKNRLSELIKSAQAGVEVVIANRNEPAVKLVPIQKKPRPPIKNSFLDWLETNPMPKYLRSSREEIEHTIAEERAAWD
jgi:prevent-host-death family protein